MKPTLLILAAGLGSRYGGVKQMDKIGPSGESIIDYSVYDAIRAGFEKVVFVLNSKIIDDFKSIYEPRLKNKIETEYILQELHNIPESLTYNSERVKPWGTGHAVLVAKKTIDEPFAVINADDFYGAQAFQLISDFLTKVENSAATYAMVGFILKNTLSEHGAVSRGVCKTEKGLLTNVVERTNIISKEDQIVYKDNGNDIPIDKDAIVSMNFWGFTPAYFKQTEKEFEKFIHNNADHLTAEFYIPYALNRLIKSDDATCKVFTSNDKWFGVTYQEDKPLVVNKIKKLIEKGEYPVAAMREMILNALVHRNYMGAPIQIRVYNDKISIWNEGYLPEGLTLEALKRSHSSRPRNPIIADVAFKGGYIDAWGRGTIKIIDTCKAAELPEPEMIERDGGFLLTILKDMLNKEHLEKMGLNERQVKATLFVKKKEKISNSEYQELYDVSKATATRDLTELVEKWELFNKVGLTGAGTIYKLKK